MADEPTSVEIEVLSAVREDAAPVRITTLPNPFTFERETPDIAAGPTIAKLLLEIPVCR
jgi:hypothetical protein